MAGSASARAVKRIEDVRGLRADAVSRRRRPDGAPGAARPLRRDQQLLHRDRLRKGRRGRAHDANAGRTRRLRERTRAVLRAPRRPGGDLRRLRASDRRRQSAKRAGAAPRSVQALVQPGRHATRDSTRALRRAVAQLYARGSSKAARRRRASRRSSRLSSRSQWVWSGLAGEVLPLQIEGEAQAVIDPATGRPAVERVLVLDEAQSLLHLRQHRRRAGAVAAARLLRAGDPDRQPVRQRAADAAGARHRPLQSLGSRAAPLAEALARGARGTPTWCRSTRRSSKRCARCSTMRGSTRHSRSWC